MVRVKVEWLGSWSGLVLWLGFWLGLAGRGEARIDLVVHVVQLLVALRRVGREHADASLALVRVRVRV